MSAARILIIGESCSDVFVYCDATRLAPDLPIPVLRALHQSENPGMAKNVQRNVTAIYPTCDIVTNDNWQDIKKTRYMHEKTNHAFMRVDSGQLMGRAEVKSLPLAEYDLVAISDYNKGFLDEHDIEYVCDRHKAVFVDTKKRVGEFLNGCLYIKINEKEFRQSAPIPDTLIHKIITTKAERGAEFRGVSYPVEQIEVKDASGAGDSFFAALLVRYAETGDIIEAIQFANLCAAEVVQHRGVSVISRPAFIKSGAAPTEIA